MFTRCLLLAVILGLAGMFTAHAREVPPALPSPLRVSVAIPVHRGNRVLSLGPNTRLHVVVTNMSNKPQRLWREWCSWGYYNLSFELKDAQGKMTALKKRVRGWSKNYPDWFELPAGEHYVIEVQLTGADWELPAKGALPPKWTLRAVYQNAPDEFTEKESIWTGKIVSPVQTYTVSDHRE